jgi:hypothetical protein
VYGPFRSRHEIVTQPTIATSTAKENNRRRYRPDCIEQQQRVASVQPAITERLPDTRFEAGLLKTVRAQVS